MDSLPMSILLIDDDPHVGRIFELVMGHYQLPLTVMDDAEVAIQYLQTNHPDIIVVDLFLPGTDGYQVLDHIRKAESIRHCTVVATTAYYTSDSQQEILARGFDGYLPKPFDTKRIVPYLRSLLGKKTNRDDLPARDDE